MSIIKSFKKLQFKKRAIVDIEGMPIPIKTLSIAEETDVKLNIPFGIPSKIDVLSAKDLNYIKTNDKNYNPVAYPAVKVYDKSSKEYIEYENNILKYQSILDGVKYIDFSYEVDGKTFLQILEEDGLPKQDIKRINWMQVCKFFDELGITDNIINEIIVAVRGLKGDTVFSRLHKLSSIINLDYIEIISYLENIVDMQKALENNEIEINDLLLKIEQLEQENAKLSIKEIEVEVGKDEQGD